MDVADENEDIEDSGEEQEMEEDKTKSEGENEDSSEEQGMEEEKNKSEDEDL